MKPIHVWAACMTLALAGFVAGALRHNWPLIVTGWAFWVVGMLVMAVAS